MSAVPAFLSIAYGGGVRGIAWDDTNRDGIRDNEEPPLTNCTVVLIDHEAMTSTATTTVDQAGMYMFDDIPAGPYKIAMTVPAQYGITDIGAGDNPALDSDLIEYNSIDSTGYSGLFTVVLHQTNIIDGGFAEFQSSVEFTVTAAEGLWDDTVFVTNGAWLEFVYTISNRGETILTPVFLEDSLSGSFLVLNFPDLLYNWNPRTVTNRVKMTASITNIANAIAIPANFIGTPLNLAPVVVTSAVAVVVVESDGDDDGDNIPNGWEVRRRLNPTTANPSTADADNDTLTDFEEYVADTDPRDPDDNGPALSWAGRSPVIAASSTERSYRLYEAGDLTAEPQPWQLRQDARPGTGGPLAWTEPDDVGSGVYRVTVEVP